MSLDLTNELAYPEEHKFKTALTEKIENEMYDNDQGDAEIPENYDIGE